MEASDFTKIGVNLTWEPYFLNGNSMPEEGEDLQAHLVKKYGPEATARYGGDDNPLAKAGKACSPPIHFKKDRFIYPTVNAHAIMEHLNGKGKREEANKVMEIMFRKYFEEGAKINSKEVLSEVVTEAEVGSLVDVDAILANEDLKQLVSMKDHEFKTKLRVSGVPFFIFHQNDGGRPQAFSGAQPTEIIAEVLEEAAGEA
jgi:predicted DsbA family dithiol-disulfide isomerase